MNPPVIICIRNGLIRRAVSRWLDCYAFEILNECETSDEALDLCKRRNSRFVIAETDLDLPAEDFCRQIRLDTKSKVVFFGDVFTSTRFYNRLMRAGASAIILKVSSYSGWVYALQKANDEPPYSDPLLLSLVLQEKPSDLKDLTDHEFQILLRITMPALELSQELGFEINFVKEALKNLNKRFNSPSVTMTALKAITSGLVLLPCSEFLYRDPTTGLSVEEIDAFAIAENAMLYVDQYWKGIRGADGL